MGLITFTTMEVLEMLIKTKNQIIEDLVDRLKDQDKNFKDTDFASDAYSSSSTRLSGESSKDQKPATAGSNKASDVDAESLNVEFAVDDAVKRSAGKHERQWLKKRNTKN